MPHPRTQVTWQEPWQSQCCRMAGKGHLSLAFFITIRGLLFPVAIVSSLFIVSILTCFASLKENETQKVHGIGEWKGKAIQELRLPPPVLPPSAPFSHPRSLPRVPPYPCSFLCGSSSEFPHSQQCAPDLCCWPGRPQPLPLSHPEDLQLFQFFICSPQPAPAPP